MRALSLYCGCLAAGVTLCGSAFAIEAPSQYPGTNVAGTQILNHAALLSSVGGDTSWYNANIPFVDLPDSAIQSVYYYRWSVFKEHLLYTSPIYGWISTEFLEPQGYAGWYGALNDAAGHHISEGRWLRNQQYMRDYMNFWTNGPGLFQTGATTWSHQYSFWLASSVWAQYLATGDVSFPTSHLQQLENQYLGWNSQFNPVLGLYWQVPLLDATEYTPESFETNDPFGGGAGYLPTFNAYQYGDATAIANIATLAGNSTVSAQYAKTAKALRKAVLSLLWDPDRQFFYPIQRDNNPNNTLLDTREEEGFVPWAFELPTVDYASGWQPLLDPQGFASAYGPTSAERRSRWFMYQAQNCCHWDGPSWPYQTAETLTGLANLLIDYPAQSYITNADYVNAMHTYAATQFKNGVPYIAEAHDPDNNNWIYDAYNHSEDYNHSTFDDNVITGLIGVRPQSGNSVVIAPLAPASWTYFALENLPYHGHNLTVVWDKTGTHYGHGAGMSVYIDGALSAQQTKLKKMTIIVPAAITQSNACGYVDAAANTAGIDYMPQPYATYTASADSVWHAVDGQVFRPGLPENTHWSSSGSPNATDSFAVNFQRNVTVREVRLNFFDDGATVRVPSSYDLQYWNGTAWLSVPDQVRSSATPLANAVNRITFSPLTTSQIRIVASNPGGGVGWGLSEVEAMSRAIFKLQNQNSGLLIGAQGGSAADGAQIQQTVNDGSTNNLWQLQDAGGGYFQLMNLNSHLVLGVQGASTSLGGLIQQQTNANLPQQLWQLIDSGSNRWKLMNKNSGLVMGVNGEQTNAGANVLQWSDSGTPDHQWLMMSADDPAGTDPCGQ